MDRITVTAAAHVVGFAPVKQLLAGTDAAAWPEPALLGLRALAPAHPAVSAVTADASLTDAARADDQIRFFLVDRVVRNFRDVATAWAREHAPARVEVCRSELLDDGSRLFFETLATLPLDVEVVFIPGRSEEYAGTYSPDEREHRIEKWCAPGAKPAEADVDFLIEESRRYLNVGDSWTAARVLAAVLAHRKTPEVFGKLGLAYAMADRTLEAEFCYLRWLESPSAVERAGARYALAMLYARHHPAPLRSLDTTADHLDRGYAELATLPDDGDEDVTFHKVFNRNGYALVEFRRGQVEQAIALLTSGIRTLKTDSAKNFMHRSVLVYNLAQCHRRSGDLPSAIRTYRELLGIDGKMPEYHMELAQCLLDVGSPAEALEELEHARRFGPAIPEVHSLLGYAHLQLDDPAAAAGAYRVAHGLDPYDVQCRYDFAYALAEAGESGEALQALAPIDVDELDPVRAAEVLTLRAEQWAATGALDVAREALRKVVVLTPGSEDARDNLATLDAYAAGR